MKPKLLFGLALAMMVGAAGLVVWFKAHQRLGQPGLLLALPPRVLQYQSEVVPTTPEEIHALPKDTSFSRRRYFTVQDGQTNFQFVLGIVLMGTDRTSIHKPQFCLVGQGWSIDKSESAEVPIQRPHPYWLPVMKLTSSKLFRAPSGAPALYRSLYVYWFAADHSLTANHWQRMWWMAKTLFQTGTLQRWGYVSCLAACRPGEEGPTFERMQEFLAAAVPEFQLATGAPRTAVAAR